MYSDISEADLTWENLGDELLYKKNKFCFAEEEITVIKRLLKKSPPPLKYRRKVKKIYNIFYIVMANKFRSSPRTLQQQQQLLPKFAELLQENTRPLREPNRTGLEANIPRRRKVHGRVLPEQTEKRVDVLFHPQF